MLKRLTSLRSHAEEMIVPTSLLRDDNPEAHGEHRKRRRWCEQALESMQLSSSLAISTAVCFTIQRQAYCKQGEFFLFWLCYSYCFNVNCFETNMYCPLLDRNQSLKSFWLASCLLSSHTHSLYSLLHYHCSHTLLPTQTWPWCNSPIMNSLILQFLQFFGHVY